MSTSSAPLVVSGLRVELAGNGIPIVWDVSFQVGQGTALGLVGESGSGKTTVAMALLGHARKGSKIAAGSVRIAGNELLHRPERETRLLRGDLVAFVPQNPSKSLSPGMRIGRQLEEMLEIHRPELSDAGDRVKEALEEAQLPATDELLRRYPHQLSGGQQQRVAIAMALVCRPAVLVMDEPTTGIDVITQARLLEVVRKILENRDTSFVYVSHDLRVVRNLVDQVAVMYGGQIVEEGPVGSVFTTPRHPYTRRLLRAIPRVHDGSRRLVGIDGSAVEPWNRPLGCAFAPRCHFSIDRCEKDPQVLTPWDGDSTVLVRCWRASELDVLDRADVTAVTSSSRVASLASTEVERPLLEIEDLVAGYGTAKHARSVPAVAGVSLAVSGGTCLAIVGESGSGKSTLARCIAGLHRPASGVIRFGGKDLPAVARERPLELRRSIQIVFQDPDSSLNPTMSVGTIIARPLHLFFSLRGDALRERVEELLEQVHLPRGMARRYPRQLSGGEKQRVALARALAAKPMLLVCDEVTSALDVAVQASILDLLRELRAEKELTMIFVSHDLAVVRTVSDEVVVMRDGVIREAATTESVFASPGDQYSRDLLAAVPDLRVTDYA